MEEHPLFEKRLHCPVCNSPDFNTLKKIEYTVAPVWDFLESHFQKRIPSHALVGVDFEVVQCGICSFIWQLNILNDVGMAKLYDEWVPAEQSLSKKKERDISLYAGYARQLEAVSHMLRNRPANLTLLDFGMGWGYLCLMARAYGYAVYGFEISRERLAYARQFGLQVTDNLADFEEGQFDFINTEQVFEHLPNPKETLTFLVSRLKQGGILRISVPNGNGISQAIQLPNWQPTHDAIEPIEHINCFTNQTLIRLAKSAGLQVGQQPRLLGQGLLGKSYGRSTRSWITSLFGSYYRRYLGTTLYFTLLDKG